MKPDSDLDEGLDHVADAAETTVQQHRWLEPALRIGWLAKAFVYGVMGWITLLVAIGHPTSTDVSYTGAVEALSRRPASRVTLLVLAVGLILYVAWRALTVALLDDNDLDDWSHRIGYGFSAATYAVIAWAALEVVFDADDVDSESFVETTSRQLLQNGGGRLLVGLGGLATVGVALYFGFKGLDRRFLTVLDLDRAGPTRRRVVEWSGAIGWFGRCLIVIVVGLFFTWAAIDADPVDARGLDRSIEHLATDDRGVVVVVAIGILLMIYALFCILSIPHRRLERT